MQQVEPHAQGVKRILSELNAKINSAHVTLIEGPAPNTQVQPPELIVYDPTAKSNHGKGRPLLLTALCADVQTWPRIHSVFTEAGFQPITTFDPMHPEMAHGAVCYVSRSRAVLIVEENPGAVRAADRVGRALLTTIIP